VRLTGPPRASSRFTASRIAAHKVATGLDARSLVQAPGPGRNTPDPIGTPRPGCLRIPRLGASTVQDRSTAFLAEEPSSFAAELHMNATEPHMTAAHIASGSMPLSSLSSTTTPHKHSSSTLALSDLVQSRLPSAAS
jgi:hypothetical protein